MKKFKFKTYYSGNSSLFLLTMLAVGTVGFADMKMNAEASTTEESITTSSSVVSNTSRKSSDTATSNVQTTTTNQDAIVNSEASNSSNADATSNPATNTDSDDNNTNSVNVENDSDSTTTTSQQSSTPQTIIKVDATSTVANGWGQDSTGNNVFFQNGQKANGYINDGTNYYFFKDGVKQSDVQKVGDTFYYFDHDTFLKVDNAYLQSRWGDWYLFGSDGSIQTDVQLWNGTYYYFNHNTFLKETNNYLQSRWGDWYLFGSDGGILTDVQWWNGTYYYFNHNTFLKETNNYLQSRWGDWYLFGKDGGILTDVQWWNGTYYFFNHSTFVKETNKYLQSRWGSWYLFKDNGSIAKGWVSYGYSSYYFDPNTFLLTQVKSSNVVGGEDSWTIGDPMRPKVAAVDISSYQSGLTQANFNMMKSLGISTVIVKLTEGTSYVNPYAANQIKMAEKAGLNVAVYDYAKFSSIASAKSEASHMVTALKNAGISTDITVIADMEDTSTVSGNAASNLTQFWNTLSASGYTKHVVYTYVSFADRAAVVSTVGNSKTWIAQYPYSPLVNTKWNTQYGGWQVSSQAYLPGYSSNLDVSIDYNGLLISM